MASTVLGTQKMSDGFLNAPNKVDPLTAAPPSSVTGPSCIKIWTSQASTNLPFAFTKYVEIILSEDYEHVMDVAVQFSLGALTSGNYCNYPAMALINQVYVLDETEVIHQFDYKSVMKSLLNKLDDNEKNTVLAAAGGTSFASGQCVAPIPLFFSRWLAAAGYNLPAFPVHRLKKGLRVRLLLEAAATVAAAGATVGSPTIDGNFIVTCGYTESGDVGYNSDYQSYDFETSTNNVVATATATDIILDGLTGSIAQLSVNATLSSNVSTAHAFFTGGAIDVIKLQVNSDRQYYEYDYASVGKYLQLPLKASWGDYSTLTIMPYNIPLSLQYNPRVYTGALNMSNINQLRVNVTHSLGANANIDVVSYRQVRYRIENGHLRRHLS